VTADLVPTGIGDVLILRTDQTFHTHAVGRVSRDGQQDVHGQADVQHVRDHAAAVAAAKTLVTPGRRIFLRDIDTGQWSEISI
jgi:hypothetical protein